MWLLLLMTSAWAAPSSRNREVVDWVASARIAGAQTQVPQYRGPATGGLPAVWAEMSSGPSGVIRRLLVRLSPQGDRNTLTEALVVTLGLRSEGGTVMVDRIVFGEVVLEGIRFDIVDDGEDAPAMTLGFQAIDEFDVVPGMNGVLQVVGGGRGRSGWVGLPRERGGDGTEEAVAAARVRFGRLGSSSKPEVRRARALDLGGTLWEAGRVQEALQVLEPVRTLVREDRCTDLVIDAQRTLAWAGGRLGSGDVQERVVNNLTTVTRMVQDHAASEEELPPMPEACTRAPGLLWALHAVLGQREEREAVPSELPSVLFASTLYGVAEMPKELPAYTGVSSAHRAIWQAERAARLGKRTEAIEAGWAALIAAPEPSVAMALCLIRIAERFPEPEQLTAYWMAAAQEHASAVLAHAWVKDRAAPEMAIDPAGSRGERAAMVAWHALAEAWRPARGLLEPSAPHTVEWWASRAFLAHRRGDLVTHDAAMAELRLRFPLHPVGTVGDR